MVACAPQLPLDTRLATRCYPCFLDGLRSRVLPLLLCFSRILFALPAAEFCPDAQLTLRLVASWIWTLRRCSRGVVCGLAPEILSSLLLDRGKLVVNKSTLLLEFKENLLCRVCLVSSTSRRRDTFSRVNVSTL